MITRAICPVMVGREDELSRVEDALLAACRGEGSVVVVAGEAGVGKSRMAAEIANRAVKVGAAFMQGGCSEAELALPYLPFTEAIGNYLGTADLDEIRVRLGPAAAELAHLFPQLGVVGQAPDAMEGAEARLRLFEAVVTLLNLVAAGRGLLFTVEDLHWADASTRELLDYLSRRVRASSILILATYRKDELHRRHPLLPTIQGWQRARLAELVELERLPPDGVARMVAAIFDTDIRDDTRDFLYRRSEGNPFVLEEMLKDALDRGDIYRTADGWERKPLEDLAIPETVRDTILLRLQRLEPDDVELLRAASVLGRSFDYEVVAGLLELPVAAAEDSLERLSEEQLVDYEQGTSYAFRHALTRDAVYETISPPRRRRLHGQIAGALAALPTAPLAERARHLFEAGRAEEAVPVCLEAAREAARRQGLREAIELFRRALPHLSNPLEQASVQGEIGMALAYAGDDAAGGELAIAAERLEQLGERREAAHLRSYRGRALTFGGWWDESIAEAERVIETLEPDGPSEDLAQAYVHGGAALSIGKLQHAKGVEWARRGLAIAEAAGNDVARVDALFILGTALAGLGHKSEGVDVLDRAADEAVRMGFLDAAAFALNNVAEDLCWNLRAEDARDRVHRLDQVAGPRAQLLRWGVRGLVESALGNLEEGLRSARQEMQVAIAENSPSTRRFGELFSALGLIELGRYSEARELMERTEPGNGPQFAIAEARVHIELNLGFGDLEAAAAAARPVLEGDLLVSAEGPALDNVVEALLAVGDAAPAARLVDLVEADELLRDLPLHWLPRARVKLSRGDAAGAAELARYAAQRFAEAGYPPFECRARLLLAQALLALDDRDGAVTALRRCWSEAVRIGSRRMEKPARELLFQLGVEVEPPREEPAAVEPEIVGERLVTVMFADVRGFTAMTGATAPAEMADRIASYQRWAKQEIEKQHGLVDKFAGDAVMASFNVSGTEVDHTLHAFKAALALRDKAALLGLPVGIGIAVGPAVVGKLTTGANTSVLGETTNLASRLQAQAEAGEVLLSGEARRRLDGWLAEHGFESASVELTLKGFDAPVAAFRLASASAAREPIGAG